MLYIITDKNNSLAGYILNDLREQQNVQIIQFSKKKKNFFQKIIRYFESKFFIIGDGLILQRETAAQLRKIRIEDSILFFDIDYIRDIQIINKFIPKGVRKNIFLWNPLKTHDGKAWKADRNIRMLRDIFDKNIYTFDKDDATKFSLLYTQQPFVKFDSAKLEKKIDVYFLGVDKGRLSKLIKIKESFEKEGLICHFHIAPSKKVNYSDFEKKFLNGTNISYEENIKNSARSRCLIEVVQDGQSGPTMRSMEAAFLECKLFTNRLSAKEDLFYHLDNVLIFDDIDVSLFKEFLNKEMHQFDDDVMAAHDIKNWWKQFL